MKTEDFIKKAKEFVAEETNKYIDERNYYQVTQNDVYLVWYSKTIQNHKALLGTHIPDHLYFEATYNGDEGELYLDTYKEINHIEKEV